MPTIQYTRQPFDWPLYLFLNGMKCSRTYRYYCALQDKQRARRFFARFITKPTGC